MKKKIKAEMIEISDKRTKEVHRGAIRILTVDNGWKVTQSRIFICDEHCGRLFSFNEPAEVLLKR